MQQFDHEKLDVYGVAIEFVTAAYSIAGSANRSEPQGDVADQLRRLSKRSATECAALVEVYRRLALVDAEVADRARATLLRIVSMLVRLVVATESGDRREARGGYA